MWTCKRLQFIWIVAYVHVGEGLEGPNAAKLAGIIRFLQVVRLPFIIFVDWKFRPRVLAMSGWLGLVDALVRRVTGEEEDGSVLEFVDVNARRT